MGSLIIRAGVVFTTLLAGIGATAQTSTGFSRSAANLTLRQNRYLGEVQNSKQQANYTHFAGGLNLEPENPRFLSYKLHAFAEGSFEAREEFYVGMPEAYVENFHPSLRFSVGRKKRTWSRLDELFNFGLWQPQLRWDYLKPEQQGLAGLFIDWNISSNFRLVFFTSQVNIPDQGPQYKLENGQFSSTNRWFQQPHSAVSMFSGTQFASDVPLYFQIDQPSYDSLFLQSSFAIGFDYDSDSGFWSHFNVAYKPRNQIHLGIECTNCGNVGGAAPLEITATIRPKIVKHFVATWETGFDRVDDRGWISLTAELPSSSGFPVSEHFVEAPLDDVLIAGAAYQHYLGAWLGGMPSWLQYSYLRVLPMNVSGKSGPLKREDQVQSSLDRYPIRDLAALDWKLRLSQKAKLRLHWTNRYQYSIPEQGGWLSSQLELNQGSVVWSLGMDVLGSQVNPRSNQAGLFTRYRANDRVFGGVSYVF